MRALGAANQEPRMKNFTDKSPSIRIVVSDSRTLQPPDLPPLNTIRWVASRKAQVVAGVHAGVWRICAVGAFLAASVPAVAWIQESALLLLVGALLVVAVGAAFWWMWRRESERQ